MLNHVLNIIMYIERDRRLCATTQNTDQLIGRAHSQQFITQAHTCIHHRMSQARLVLIKDLHFTCTQAGLELISILNGLHIIIPCLHVQFFLEDGRGLQPTQLPPSYIRQKWHMNQGGRGTKAPPVQQSRGTAWAPPATHSGANSTKILTNKSKFTTVI